MAKPNLISLALGVAAPLGLLGYFSAIYRVSKKKEFNVEVTGKVYRARSNIRSCLKSYASSISGVF